MSLRLERPLQEAPNWNLHNYCVDYWLIQHTMMTDCLFIFIFLLVFTHFQHFTTLEALKCDINKQQTVTDQTH